ncbi:DUF3365 domain-containing protein [Myxococcus sp. RHSTA-1-4]|uniref:c-type heme family protein n=1 Tax=Myxococcus sp. RHSTA-1-4 TaxID=2874601 RepID=UPI001CBDB838|nr:DUF3365 domain-containing protein [Myxococcus sp. RHSTA-1-4]MBZ4415689.1 DUF3365 domain-containing protein [Myxococcus sp. RHSTA-1-4]
MRLQVMAWGVALVLGGCSSAPRHRVLEPVPPDVAPRVAAAEATMTEVQQRLFKRLTAELERGGPAAAVTVCRDEAQPLTASVAHERSIEVGRTSHKLRNPKNAPRAWVAPFVSAAAGAKAADVKPVVVDLGDRVGVLKPIPTAPLCTSCHGAREALSPEVAQALKDGYPTDAAVGFAPGDLRGFFWAEVPR